MVEKWRLVESCRLVLNKEAKEVTFRPTDVKKAGDEGILLSEPEFDLKFDDSLTPWIKWKEEYYTVKNFIPTNEARGKLIRAMSGLEGTKLDPVFSEEAADAVWFVKAGTQEYKDASDEMIRRLNCSMMKKTRKWKPGHRYDSEDKTYYYLGKFVSHRKNYDSSEFLHDPIECHLVVEKIPDGVKTIPDVLRTGLYGSTGKEFIHTLWGSSLPLMVDSGQALTDSEEPWDLQSLYMDQLKNIYETGAPLEKALEVFAYTDKPDNVFLPGSVDLDPIVSQVKVTMMNLLIEWWGLKYNGDAQYVGSDQNEEGNIKGLVTLFSGSLDQENIFRTLYYPELFRLIGIDLTALAKEAIINWGGGYRLKSDFDYYVNVLPLWRKHHREIVDLDQASSGNTNNFLGNKFSSHLAVALEKLLISAASNGGEGVTSWKEINRGTANRPDIVIQARVLLSDILALGEPSETLKSDIINSGFQELNIKFMKDKGVK